MRSIFEYQSQAVRDLVWAMTSPSLMAHPSTVDARWGERELERHPGLLSRLDRPKSSLQSALRAAGSKRLGSYFELLVQTWMHEVPPARVMCANLQVAGKGGTVGEFDLVFRRDQAFHHWELAVKFYLGHPNLDGDARWFGPNPADRLDRKWRKMIKRQLRLSHRREARAALSAKGVDTPVRAKAFVKGYLFEALDPSLRVQHHPDTNPDGLRGWWCHHGQLQAHRSVLDGKSMQWLVLPRLRWMSPAKADEKDVLHSWDTLGEELPTHRASLIAGLEKTAHGWTERTRGFVVPDRWPG